MAPIQQRTNELVLAMQTLRYFSVFSGAGGFEIGIERAVAQARPYLSYTAPSLQRDNGTFANILGYPECAPAICIGFSEINPAASAVLRYNFPGVHNHGDISQIDWRNIPDFDLLVGGSPCQDFSSAGNRAGLVGNRSGLAFEFIRALREKQPGHFIWENVRGVFSSNRGWDFAAIIHQMAAQGYPLPPHSCARGRLMNWYTVVKTIKGRRYLYLQKTYRENGRVKTLNKYLGPAASLAIPSLVAAKTAQSSSPGSVARLSITPQTASATGPYTPEDAMRLLTPRHRSVGSAK